MGGHAIIRGRRLPQALATRVIIGHGVTALSIVGVMWHLSRAIAAQIEGDRSADSTDKDLTISRSLAPQMRIGDGLVLRSYLIFSIHGRSAH